MGQAMKKPTAIVVGVGAFNGLGATLCKLFAAEGFHVWVAGRTEDKLQAVIDQIISSGGSAEPAVMDASNEQQVVELFAAANQQHQSHHPPSLVVFNGGSFARTPIREMSAMEFEEHWRGGCFAGFLVGREAAKTMTIHGGGTLLFSGATASLRGKANYAHFSSAKAGLRMISQSIARELGPMGVHVAHVILDGGIMREHKTAQSAVNVRNRPERSLMDYDAVAQVYLQIHRQPRSAWTAEIDLRSNEEPF
jgi:NAD(P)-dependent dehydrogenase (short-subunit alcohol dehydrogenase family)